LGELRSLKNHANNFHGFASATVLVISGAMPAGETTGTAAKEKHMSNGIEEPERLMSEHEAAEGLKWLERFYSQNTPAGANARCVGGLLRGMLRVYELEHGDEVSGGLTHKEFCRVLDWLGVYRATGGAMGKIASGAANKLTAFADAVDPWGQAHESDHEWEDDAQGR
jgi:hypothetical protein